ncbi:hypothetical protein QWA68_016628 [Fusarium oxysporum]|nr:hypothetical protein QWA68_016628 [Fusarium oxysporum]
MTGLVGLSARQPPSSILGPGKDTREPLETAIEPDDTQAMSPQMTSEEVEALKREMHTELHRLVKPIDLPIHVKRCPRTSSRALLTSVCCCGYRHAKALRDLLLLIFNRVEAVEKGYEKLDSNEKVLQKYVEDLTSIHQTTASDSHEKH